MLDREHCSSKTSKTLMSTAKAISRLSYKTIIDIADMASMLLNFSYQTRAVGNSGDKEFRLKIWFL